MCLCPRLGAVGLGRSAAVLAAASSLAMVLQQAWPWPAAAL